MLKAFWTEDGGAILSAELILVLTIAVLAMAVGLSQLATALTGELSDLAEAFGAIDQSVVWGGHFGCCATVSGSAFGDSEDTCDCNPISSCGKNNFNAEKCE